MSFNDFLRQLPALAKRFFTGIYYLFTGRWKKMWEVAVKGNKNGSNQA